MGNFRDLKVWERSKNLVVYIYRFTSVGKFSKDYGLRDQIRRAAVSIPSNIAEGDELGTNKQAINFFYFAKGSTAEVLTQSIVAKEIGYINSEESDHINEECNAISSMRETMLGLEIVWAYPIGSATSS